MERKSIPKMGVWTRVPRSNENDNDVVSNWIPKEALNERDQEESLLDLDSQLAIPITRTWCCTADWTDPLTVERLEVGEKVGDKAEYGYVYS